MINIFDIVSIEIKQIILTILYIVIGIVCYKIIKKIINKITNNNKKKLKANQHQRIKTINMLILNVIKYIICILVLIAILAVFGVNVSSLLAGLGITTAIIGLAFQDLAKDLIAGISIITESQYEVGDTIEVDGFMGEVIFLGLKTTRIRDYKGATKIIANHNMDKIINYSLNNSLAIVDVGVDYQYQPEEVEKVLENLSKKLKGKIPDAIGDIEVWGINKLDDSCVEYRVVLEVRPMKNISVERLLRKEIKKALDEADIKIPFPQIEVHHGK